MPSTDQAKKDILDILTALEYGTKKEEKEILDSVLATLGVQRRRTKKRIAADILEGRGFEAFLLEVLSEVRPFALMLRDVYAFLNRSEAITRRRASTFRVSSANAAAKLDFSLDNFPRELIAALAETEARRAVVELRFPGLGQDSDQVTHDWSEVEASQAWRAISPSWDNDFYDGIGFHRALSYAHTMLLREDEGAWSRLREITEPILDRLAAIVVCANSVRPLEISSAYFSGVQFQPSLPEPRSHRTLCDEARPYLLQPTKTQYRDAGQRTVHDELSWNFYSMAVAIHFFRNERIQRADRDWLKSQLNFPTPETYLSLVDRLAASYRQKLDIVAPVVEEWRERVLEKRLIEFLLLPFWKNRWFLYELWTLVLTLDIAGRNWGLDLKGLEETAPGVIEWQLPGGTATQPVAEIGDGEPRVLCWTQRKTYHPGTGKGLEPDLRFTAALPGYHDLVIVENKDRRKPSGPEMEEIARRYVEGTCTESFWFVNYDSFTNKLERLETIWDKRKVHVISEFRPGQVPDEFQQELETILARHLGRPTVTPTELVGRYDIDKINVTLTWGSQPRDLDLHIWVARDDGMWQVSFRDRGRLDSAPFAELDGDVIHGNGCETVQVLTPGLRSLTVAVHNYSNESRLALSNAEVLVTLGDRRRIILLAPENGHGRWWTVATYNHLTAQIMLANEFGEMEPTVSPTRI